MRKTILVAGAALAALWSGGAGAPVSANAKGASSPEVRVQLVQGREESLTKALARLKDPDPEARQRAAEYLGQKGDMTVVKPLASSLADPNPEVRAQTERSMWKIWLRSGDPEVDKILYVGIEFMATGRLQSAIDAFTEV
ncbi:MAG: HEAT repeat domain-containing protein, partial [Nitrospinota bacterium]